MTDKLKLINQAPNPLKLEKEWDQQSEQAKALKPNRIPKNLPKMPGIAPETKKGLKWKALKYLILHDPKLRVFRKHILKRPFFHFKNYIKSLFSKKPYERIHDFFYYGIKNDLQFYQELNKPNTHFVIGFSYCEKPLECPSGRFNDECANQTSNPVCQQCLISKVRQLLPKKDTTLLIIPTIHYIGEKLFEVHKQHKDKNIVFLITACELSLEMFGDWGKMAGFKGIGVRLDGRICNTMRAFELSEKGIKPGLTLLLEKTEKQFLEYVRTWHLQKLSSTK